MSVAAAVPVVEGSELALHSTVTLAGADVKDGDIKSLEYICAESAHVRLPRPEIPLLYVNERKYVEGKDWLADGVTEIEGVLSEVDQVKLCMAPGTEPTSLLKFITVDVPGHIVESYDRNKSGINNRTWNLLELSTPSTVCDM